MLLLKVLQGQGAAKLFESEAVSLTMNIQINLVQKDQPQLLVLTPVPIRPQPLNPTTPDSERFHSTILSPHRNKGQF